MGLNERRPDEGTGAEVLGHHGSPGWKPRGQCLSSDLLLVPLTVGTPSESGGYGTKKNRKVNRVYINSGM